MPARMNFEIGNNESTWSGLILAHSGRANDSPTYCSCDQMVSSLRNLSGPARLTSTQYAQKGRVSYL